MCVSSLKGLVEQPAIRAWGRSSERGLTKTRDERAIKFDDAEFALTVCYYHFVSGCRSMAIEAKSKFAQKQWRPRFDSWLRLSRM